ncbi:MAG: hypothetical protein ACLTG4_03050 [Oscillospiraceae bacterium]
MAGRSFFDTFGGEPDGLTIRITKRIPSGAGLGGGSADAAAGALNRWKDYPLSVYALCELGRRSAPTFRSACCAARSGRGRGERLTKLPDAPEMFTVICKPDVSFHRRSMPNSTMSRLPSGQTRAPCEPREGRSRGHRRGPVQCV